MVENLQEISTDLCTKRVWLKRSVSIKERDCQRLYSYGTFLNHLQVVFDLYCPWAKATLEKKIKGKPDLYFNRFTVVPHRRKGKEEGGQLTWKIRLSKRQNNDNSHQYITKLLHSGALSRCKNEKWRDRLTSDSAKMNVNPPYPMGIIHPSISIPISVIHDDDIEDDTCCRNVDDGS